jgi:HSP20 family protein
LGAVIDAWNSPFATQEVTMGSQFPARSSSSREMRSVEPLRDLRRQMDRLFEDFFTGGPLGNWLGTAGGSSAFGGLETMPRIDLHEEEQELCVQADVPGVKPSDVDVRLDGDMLTISGEKRMESDRKEEDYQVMERSYGRFRRTIQLPFAPDAEQVRAECQDGVLTVHVPKQAQTERSHRIEVQGGTEAGSPRLQSQAGTQGPGGAQTSSSQEGRSQTQSMSSGASGSKQR